MCVRQIKRMVAKVPLKYVLTNGQIEKALKIFIAAAWEKRRRNDRICVMDKRFNSRRAKGKRANGRELDFLALEAGAPRFWIEAKCTFAQDRVATRNAARSALRQVATTLKTLSIKRWTELGTAAQRKMARRWRAEWKERGDLMSKAQVTQQQFVARQWKRWQRSIQVFRRRLLRCPTYIVHFVTVVPRHVWPEENGLWPAAVMANFPLVTKPGNPAAFARELKAIYLKHSRCTCVERVSISTLPPVYALVLRRNLKTRAPRAIKPQRHAAR